MSDDEGGGYGHPDHVRAHVVARAAADMAGLPFVEVVTGDSDDAGVHWAEYTGHREDLLAAHDCYRTQFTRHGDRITHVGGQTQPLRTRVGLRGQ